MVAQNDRVGKNVFFPMGFILFNPKLVTKPDECKTGDSFFQSSYILLVYPTGHFIGRSQSTSWICSYKSRSELFL